VPKSPYLVSAIGFHKVIIAVIACDQAALHAIDGNVSPLSLITYDNNFSSILEKRKNALPTILFRR
jgi:hypothetical protein